jgi:hypothetical protein
MNGFPRWIVWMIFEISMPAPNAEVAVIKV